MPDPCSLAERLVSAGGGAAIPQAAKRCPGRNRTRPARETADGRLQLQRRSCRIVLSGHRPDDRDPRHDRPSPAVTTQYSSRRALAHRRVLHHRVGMFQSSRPRRSKRTLTPASTNPAKTIRVPQRAPNPAGLPDDRPLAPPCCCSSVLSVTTTVRPLLTTAPQSTVPSPTCFLCRALTPTEPLYGGWAGSGPGTGRNPSVHRGSGADTESTAQSMGRSWALTASVSSVEQPRRGPAGLPLLLLVRFAPDGLLDGPPEEVPA
jgi:hypothetical protein